MRERDPAQQAIDEAVLDAAETLDQEHREDMAVLLNHAIVKAFSGKGG